MPDEVAYPDEAGERPLQYCRAGTSSPRRIIEPIVSLQHDSMQAFSRCTVHTTAQR